MSYIVLARKYRPQSFKDVFAQEHVTEIIQSALATDRIAHAYLFTGPRGVGKTSMARILAKSLNCIEGPTVTPCNKCSNCMEITAGTSNDVIEIDGASNTGVDDIRELQRELLYAPSGSKYKIYIIDEVHMLSKNAFNALLKTLEEPPENVIFIFATTEPHKVIATIISRCQRYDFKRIPVQAIVRQLQLICQEEKIEIDNESMYLIARKADGGMRDALSLMDQSISYCMNHITIDKVRQIFGMIPNQVYYDIMRLIDAKDALGAVQQVHSIFEQGTDLQEFLANMLEFIRIIILRKLGVPLMDINPDELPLFDELAGIFGQNKLMYMLSMLIGSRNDLRTSSNPYLIMEALMIKLCKTDEMEDVANLIKQLPKSFTTSISQSSSAPVRNTQPIHSAPASTPVHTPDEPVHAKLDFTPENIDSAWQRIVSRVKKISGMTAVALEQAQSKEVSGNKLKLTLSSATHHATLKGNQEKVQSVLTEVFTQPVTLELILVEGEKRSKVEIKRRSIDDLKSQNADLKSYIETTDSILA